MRNYDVSLKGIVIGHSQSEDGKFVFEVVVMSAIQHNRVAKRTFEHPSIVKIGVYPGNITTTQVEILKQKAAVATFNMTIVPELLVEDVVCGNPLSERELAEFIKTMYGGR